MHYQQRRRLPSEGLRCHESIERDHVRPFIVFHCALPDPYKDTALEFRCRDSSCGALEAGEEVAALFTDENYEYCVDPNFFDDGYSMAGSTGFKVWTGSRLLIETLAWPHPEDCTRLQQIQHCIRNGAHILELGSGVGIVGTYLSAIGSQVLLTDLPTLVENAIVHNLERNMTILLDASSSSDVSPPSGTDSTTPSTTVMDIAHDNIMKTTRRSYCWLGSSNDDDDDDDSSSRILHIGQGWASATPLDWTHPLEEQLTQEQASSIEFIIASDVIFLVSMLTALLDTVDSIFQASSSSKNPSFLLSFQRRDAKDASSSSSGVAFTTVSSFVAEIHARGWTLDCLAWRPVMVCKETNDGNIVSEESEVFLFEIKMS